MNYKPPLYRGAGAKYKNSCLAYKLDCTCIYSYHLVLYTPLFLCTVAIFECNSNVKQVVFYRDMSEVQFELVIASLDDVNCSVGPDVTIWGCVSKNL
jgi:hypothetical protein